MLSSIYTRKTRKLFFWSSQRNRHIAYLTNKDTFWGKSHLPHTKPPRLFSAVFLCKCTTAKKVFKKAKPWVNFIYLRQIITFSSRFWCFSDFCYICTNKRSNFLHFDHTKKHRFLSNFFLCFLKCPRFQEKRSQKSIFLHFFLLLSISKKVFPSPSPTSKIQAKRKRAKSHSLF